MEQYNPLFAKVKHQMLTSVTAWEPQLLPSSFPSQTCFY